MTDIEKNTTSKKERTEQIQSKKYLSYIYSTERRPLTDYPNKLAKKILENLDIKKKISLLDAGCGRGDVLKAFQALGCDVEGADISEEAMKLLKPIKVHQVDLQHEAIENKDSYYDIIFSKSLIEHLNDPLTFMINCKNMIKNEGTVVIMTPSWIHHSFGPFYLDYTHRIPFTLHSLRDIGHLAGFAEVKVSYFYQLPITWKYPWTKIFSKLISFLKIPYLPVYEGLIHIKLPTFINKYIKFSREVMLYAEMKK
tara:strand:- start:3268 stop:4029 length:762 start_codon:yes stop_codon:yes gene_type:complete